MNFKQYFIDCYPYEGVGYLKNGEFFPLENIAEDKLNTFEVNPSFLLQEPDVLLHSHITGIEETELDPRTPSFADLQGQIQTAIEWGICVTDGRTCEDPIFWGNPQNRPPLEGRDFIFNVQDCLCLCQDWFYQEHGVVLPTVPRHPLWHMEGENYMEELYESWGFQKVAPHEMQRGDVLFYRVRSPVINHLGIYLGNNEVLSHWFGRTSAIESFGTWASHIEFAARYIPDNAEET